MIELQKDGELWMVRINRPDKANSLTESMLTQLAEIAEDAATDRAKALILTGSGRVFSAGADLDEARAGLATSPIWERLSSAIATFPGLSIAALNGTLAGGAFGMVLACDIRLAVASAKFFYPVMKLGFLPQPSDPARMVSLVGPARAKLVLMAGQKIEAAEALDWGLIDRLVPDDVLIETARGLCTDVIAASPDHVASIKHLICQTAR